MIIGWIRPTEVSNAPSESPPVDRPATPEAFFLGRLNRLVELSARSDLDPIRRRQVNHALYSTYWDCAGLGLRAEAIAILGLPTQERRSSK